MKTIHFILTLGILWSGCSKNDPQSPGTPPTPVNPDTLTTGWSDIVINNVNRNITDVFFTDNQNGYVTSEDGIYKSSNGGASWTKIYTASNLYNIAASGSNACFVNGGRTIYSTQDNGASFQTNAYQVANSGVTDFTDLMYTSNNVVYATTNKYVWKSINGGLTFDTIYKFNLATNMNPTIFFTDENNGWISRGDLGLYKTTDGGLHWTNNNNANSNGTNGIFFLNANLGFYCIGYGMYKTTNAGASWELKGNISNGAYMSDIHFVNTNTGYCCAGNRIYKTTDGGNTWNVVVALGNNYLIELHFTDENHGWASGSFGRILRFLQ